MSCVPKIDNQLFIRDRRAAWTGQVQQLKLFKTDFLAPAFIIGKGVIKGVAEFDQHIKRHQETKGVRPPRIVDDILDGDERPAFGQRVVGQLDQMFLSKEQLHRNQQHIT